MNQIKNKNKLEMLGSIVSSLAHYDAGVNLSTLCNRGIFWQGTYLAEVVVEAVSHKFTSY